MVSKNVGELKALAQKHSLQGKRALAAETYQLLIKEEPANPRWPQKAGEEYRTTGQRDKAVASFQIAARLYAHQGFTLKAITLCKLILDLDKVNQAARELLASISATSSPPLPRPQPPPTPAPARQPGPAPTPGSSGLSVQSGPLLEMIELPRLPEPSEFIDMIELREFPEPEPPPRRVTPVQQPQPLEIPGVPEMLDVPTVLGVSGESEASGVAMTPDVPKIPRMVEVPGRPPALVDDRRTMTDPAINTGPPADTLLADELSRVIPPAVSSLKFDVAAFEILLDDPETPKTVPELQRRAPPAIPPTEEILTHMPPIPIFSSLGRSTLQALVERVQVRTFAPGVRIITQGEEGNSLFVLVDGAVVVYREGPPRVELTHLKEGAFFGEIALVTKAPRTATVEAVRECLVLEISREVFNELVQSHPGMLKVILRYLRERLVNGLVGTHPLFAPFAGAERTNLVRRFSLLEAARGYILAERGVHANGMYIILCGKAECKRGDALPTILTSGDIFGVESLLTGQPSLVSVRTLTKCWILKMREDTFREVILSFPPVLAILSDMIADQCRRTEAADSSGALEQPGIPLF